MTHLKFKNTLYLNKFCLENYRFGFCRGLFWEKLSKKTLMTVSKMLYL